MLIGTYFLTLGEACTIVLRGATQQILDEAERSLHDALCVLAQTVKDSRTVYGGGKHLENIKHFISFLKVWYKSLNAFSVSYRNFILLLHLSFKCLTCLKGSQ